MSVAEVIQAMPKVELNLRLEGALRKKTLLTIAEQNDIPASTKNFDQLVEQLDHPDFGQLDTLLQTVGSWLQHPEDLGRVVYDAGVSLARQNVKYAEICVNTNIFMQNGLTLETLMSALNDGRSRAERGWNIRIGWILTVPRTEPRRADETVRWASSAAARRHGVVGFGVIGPEDVQPIGQFERAFASAEKKELPTFIQTGNTEGADGILKTINLIKPHRLLDAFSAWESPDVIDLMIERDTPIVVSVRRALAEGLIDHNPTRSLYDSRIGLVLTSDLPVLVNASLADEYLAAVESGGLSLEELQQVALNAVRYSFLPQNDKDSMLQEFQSVYDDLREGPLASESN